MSVFLEILGFVFGRNDKGKNDRDDETSKRNSSVESASSETSVKVSSSPSCNDLLRQSDPNIIYYYEDYPNLPISNSTAKEPNAASLQSNLRRAPEVSQSSAKHTSTSSNSSSSAPKPPKSSVESSSFPKPAIPPSSIASSSSSFGKSLSSDQPLLSQSSSQQAPPSSKPSISNSAKEPNAASLQSNLRRAPEVPQFSAKHTSTSSNSSSSAPKPPKSFAESSSFPKPAIPSSSIASSSSSFGKSLSSDQPLLSQSSSQQAPPSSKPTLSALPTNQHTQANYTVIQKATSPIYMIPKDIEDLIKKDIVPDVLKKPLSPTTYKDYFAALLYAEDFYIEKWSEFKLVSVTLKLHKATIYNKPPRNENLKGNDEKQDKMFVAFEVDSVPERRPFLLARDFVYARRLGSTVKQFQGLLYRVVKSNIVLVEFEEDFYSQHHSDRKYDISFSFNRVCLKRAHHAIAAASGPFFHNYLFPDGASRKNEPPSPPIFYCNYKLGSDQTSAVRQILNFRGSPPYLVEGPLSVTESRLLSKTGIVVREAVLQIYRSSPRNRILICAPINRTCDVLIRSLREEIPESDMFRANAAFREVDGVQFDILPLCLYEGECFSCPSLQNLRQFRVIFSTFVSSSRLHNEGITAGHFSHIFLVDDSSATEPETMIALGNLANENTSVIVSGAPDNYSSWVRSDIARKKGLRISYFQRLRENKTYKSLEPMFITRL